MFAKVKCSFKNKNERKSQTTSNQSSVQMFYCHNLKGGTGKFSLQCREREKKLQGSGIPASVSSHPKSIRFKWENQTNKRNILTNLPTIIKNKNGFKSFEPFCKDNEHCLLVSRSTPEKKKKKITQSLRSLFTLFNFFFTHNILCWASFKFI